MDELAFSHPSQHTFPPVTNASQKALFICLFKYSALSRVPTPSQLFPNGLGVFWAHRRNTKGGKECLTDKECRAAKRERVLAFGPYSAQKLADAQAMSRQARDMLRNRQYLSHILSVHERRIQITRDVSRSFEKLARNRHTLQTPQWKARHASDVLADVRPSRRA